MEAFRYTGHLHSLQHRRNCCVGPEEEIQVIHTSYRNRLATYRLNGRQDPTNVGRFLNALKENFLRLVGDFVKKKYDTIKVGIKLFGRFLLQAKRGN